MGGTRKSQGVTDVVEKNLRIFDNIYDNYMYFDRLIHFGSGAEYDKSRPLHEIEEDDFGDLVPQDSYGFSKYLISKCIEREQEGNQFVCLRLFGVFGKYDDYTFKFISNSIVKYLLGIPIHIHQNVVFDWMYVQDLVRILPSFLDEKRWFGGSYNLTTGTPVDLLTIAKLINNPKKVDIVVENSGWGNSYTGKNYRLIKYLEQPCFTPMPLAISNLKLYYESILSTIDAEKIKEDELRTLCKTKVGGD